MSIPRIATVLLTLILLPIGGFAESRFELQEQPGSDAFREFVLVHHTDKNSTPTAAQAAFILRTTDSSGLLLNIKVVPRYEISRTPRRGTPVPEAGGHEAQLLVGVKKLSPGAAFADDAEICRFQVPAKARGDVRVIVSRDRGGLRSWSGQDLTPASSIIAKKSLGDD
ncbi:hypothetical protein KQI84_01145 [bacterium]|nr:hypothetical protein [bacterium]